jgi:dolichol kinase
VGDLFGKMIGRQFGRLRLYRRKTLEGTLAFFSGSVLTGYIFHTLLPIPILFVLAGSAFAAIVELLTDRANDNFTVGILSSGFLYALRFFLARIP